jgi:radical SAM family RiPP maturation amino acid epimerase
MAELDLRSPEVTDGWVTPGIAGNDWRRTERELAEIWRTHPQHFQSVVEPVAARRVAYASELAHVKRFGERWRADRAFREALPDDPRGAAARYRLPTDAEEMRCLWDGDFAASREPGWEAPLAVQRHRLFGREKLLHREKLRSVECVPAEPRWRAWRARQINRAFGHLGPRAHDGIIHAPFAIELSDGCSVGCWFCGVSAERKRGDFPYTPENAGLWRDVLGVLRDLAGASAAATGFCYWATDPLDNPDYERFCVDVAEICGRFPQTTTAQPHKDFERTRRLLRLSVEHGCTINRFSVLTLRIFDAIMEAFSAEELLHCEIVSQNPEAVHVQSNAGRALGSPRLGRLARDHGVDPIELSRVPGTIACVSGFLLNMVRRTVRLITPCPSDARWPDGYWTYEEARFEDAASLRTLLEGMIERHMRATLRAGDRGRFRADLRYDPAADGFRLHAFGATTTVTGGPELRALGDALAGGDRTVGEIAVALEDALDRPAPTTMGTLNRIFDDGVLDEEPLP